MPTHLLQIVPRLPPAICGVGSYAWNLALALQRISHVETRFAVAHPTSDIQASTEVLLLKANVEAVANLVSDHSGPVLLHYSGYGYDPVGVPTWLVKGLLQARNTHRKITMIHEVYASGPVWRRAFWTRPFQIRVVQNVIRWSDHIVTSNTRYAHVLGDIDSCHLNYPSWLTVVPVFSNVGEPDEVLPLKDRPSQAIVFGSWGRRQAVYDKWSDFLPHIEAWGLESILDVGPGSPVFPKHSWLQFLPQGKLPSEQVSVCITQARVGLLCCPINILGKSTVYAAYSSHGTVPLIYSESILESADDDPYLTTRSTPSYTSDMLDKLSHSVLEAYRNRSLQRTAQLFAKWIEA